MSGDGDDAGVEMMMDPGAASGPVRYSIMEDAEEDDGGGADQARDPGSSSHQPRPADGAEPAQRDAPYVAQSPDPRATYGIDPRMVWGPQEVRRKPLRFWPCSRRSRRPRTCCCGCTCAECCGAGIVVLLLVVMITVVGLGVIGFGFTQAHDRQLRRLRHRDLPRIDDRLVGIERYQLGLASAHVTLPHDPSGQITEVDAGYARLRFFQVVNATEPTPPLPRPAAKAWCVKGDPSWGPPHTSWFGMDEHASTTACEVEPAGSALNMHALSHGDATLLLLAPNAGQRARVVCHRGCADGYVLLGLTLPQPTLMWQRAWLLPDPMHAAYQSAPLLGSAMAVWRTHDDMGGGARDLPKHTAWKARCNAWPEAMGGGLISVAITIEQSDPRRPYEAHLFDYDALEVPLPMGCFYDNIGFKQLEEAFADDSE